MLYVNARFLTQHISGVQRYAVEISRFLKKLNNNVKFVAPRNILHSDLAVELDVKIIGSLTGHLWEQYELPKYLKSNGSPLLLNLANTAPLFYQNKISTLHDIAFERFPETFSWKFRFAYQFSIPKIIKDSKMLLTVSSFSRNEISALYGISHKNIIVVYNAASTIFRPKNKETSEKYILAVSSLNYQKNFYRLIQAFNLLCDKSIKLYLVGALNRNFIDYNLVKEINSNSNIKFLGRVDDEDLVTLYSNAQCFIYPSLYEGFGIPPLEAQACGCSCIVSNAASLPEVYGDSVVYCDPYNIHDIAEKIKLVINSETLRKELQAKGYCNVNRFGWERSAAEILNSIKILE